MKKIKQLGKKVLGNAFSQGTPLYEIYHKSRGVLAATTSGFPASKMIVIGITGTNGKTATSTMLAHILEASGKKVGLMTTVNFWIGKKKWVNESKMTTDNPFTTQTMLRRMVKAGCKYAVVETSSHALAQHRTWGIFYDVAVFTNLTQDHLDYHHTMEDYRTAKEKLFKDLAGSWKKPGIAKTIVLNFDDPMHAHFAKYPAEQKLFFSANKNETPPDTLKAREIHTTSTGSIFTISSPKGSIKVQLNIPGKFNIENALAAASSAFALGFSLEDIKKGLESVHIIPGRMEYIQTQPFNVIADYAHTPDGYEKSLSSIRQFTEGRIIAVFGSAGDRDREKRPLIGKIAGKYADTIILTEEDPASEDPAKIIEAIKSGVPTDKFQEGGNQFTILDRKEAVKHALSLARAKDTVVLLSLGAQTKMATKDGLVDYDEREYAKNLLQLASKKLSSHPEEDDSPVEGPPSTYN
jgi:UDP-N-acetylmuramoyl-L-alanyl-D-glutamate--2,6-diaminopimelate ligase